MKIITNLIALLLFTACSVQQISQSIDDYMKSDEPTTDEVASGLKEALIQGITKGSDNASKQDGYFGNSLIRIPFPPDAIKVANTLKDIGMEKEVDRFVMTLNRGAEEAAKSAQPIFISAIKQMTIQDAWAILKGEDDAATQYLKRTTSGQLYQAFNPVIKKSLDKVSATKYYGDLVSAYNKVPFVEKVNPDLNDYATNLGKGQLFTLISQEEANIRKDPVARVSALLKKVFGYKG
ncbi:MAG: DUF4197 domain-containing protein [Bacteroidetes bacterium]|nr:DUF4197 domain-containing protein [Bacteroidota bacterium]